MPEQPSWIDTLYCEACNRPVMQSNGKFLRPVIVLCDHCKRRHEWHPEKKVVDKNDTKAHSK